MTAEWRYDESIAPGVDYGKDESVALYEKGRAEIGDPDEETRQLIAMLGIRKDWTVIDMGCGTGAFVVETARHCRKVIGVDISRKMLAGARQRLHDGGLGNVELVEGSFLTFQYEGEPVDAIVSKVALYHLPDFWKQVALLKMNRMLKPGGKLCIADVIYSFAPADYQREHDAFVERMQATVSPEFMKNVELDLRREFMTTNWIIEGMLARAGFCLEQLRKMDNFFSVYLCSKVGSGERPAQPTPVPMPNPQVFAREWIEAWNSHDLDRILSHYTDDFEITSPMIKVALGVDSGTLRGKDSVRRYWSAALEKVPDLHFELIEATASVGSIGIYYRAIMNKRAMEVMFFDERGKIARTVAHYTSEP